MLVSALVGRDRPAAALRVAIARLLEGQGGLVLVTGEAGIGKTALVAEAGREARGRRAVVLFGACWEGEGVPGYWPWIQVVRAERVASPAAWAGEDAATITLETLLATGALTWSSS